MNEKPSFNLPYWPLVERTQVSCFLPVRCEPCVECGLMFTARILGTQPRTTPAPSKDANLAALSVAAERAKVGTTLAPVIAKSACDTERGMLVEQGRTLRLQYRSIHHVNIRTLRQCEELCAKTAIKCATFAYSPRSRDCLISSSSIDRNSRFAAITQASPSFDLYAFLGSACNLGTNMAGTVMR